MKSKYHIENNGCHESTVYDIELTNEELQTIIKIFEENNKNANYTCTPDIYVYKYKEKEDYYNEKALNRSYIELKESEKN